MSTFSEAKVASLKTLAADEITEVLAGADKVLTYLRRISGEDPEDVTAAYRLDRAIEAFTVLSFIRGDLDEEVEA